LGSEVEKPTDEFLADLRLDDEVLVADFEDLGNTFTVGSSVSISSSSPMSVSRSIIELREVVGGSAFFPEATLLVPSVGGGEKRFVETVPRVLPSGVRVETEAAEGVVLSLEVATEMEEQVLYLMVAPELIGVLSFAVETELGGTVLSLIPERSALVKRRLGLGGEVGVAMVGVGSLTVACAPARRLTEFEGVDAFFLSALASAKKVSSFR
jgi:hypothetical protein